MNDADRVSWNHSVHDNIAKFGFHVTLVSGKKPWPRFAYSIGLRDAIGVDIILAGASIYTANEIGFIVNSVAQRLMRCDQRQMPSQVIELNELGGFHLREVHPTWATALMLGCLDIYKCPSTLALQVVPDEAHWTIDIPNLSRPWDSLSEPVWRWKYEAWSYPVGEDSVVSTNLDALRGKRVTEAARWEADQWELFAGAGPDVDEDDVRVVPLSTLLGFDESLEPVTRLAVGGALWRESDQVDWKVWTSPNYDVGA